MDYFGSYKDESWREFEALQEQVGILREGSCMSTYYTDDLENNALEEQQNALVLKIEEIKEEQARREEEERQRELEA